MPSDPPITLRLMTSADVPACLRLKQAANWNQLEVDVRRFLEYRPQGCFVAECGDQVVGTVTTMLYPAGLGWIGMLLVDANFRRRGIGSQLLLAAVENLAEFPSAKLDATPAGREVYCRHGFEDEYELGRFIRPAGQPLSASDQTAAGKAAGEIRPLTAADLDAVDRLDTQAFGCSRRQLIADWLATSPGYALAAEGPRGLVGYCLGRSGARFEQIGPLVAERSDTAAALLSAALVAVGDRAAVLDAPKLDAGWIAALAALGFGVERGICGPEWG